MLTSSRLLHGCLILACATGIAGCAGEGLSVPPEKQTVAPLPELSGAAAEGLTEVPWSLQELDPGGTVATLTVMNGGCYDVRGVRTDLTPTGVHLTLLAAEPATGCTSAVASIVSVRLPEPLGSRSLRPGPAPST
ncbi:MAG TPA: hypothetical protein VF657_10155 [Actinoplanes sp.]